MKISAKNLARLQRKGATVEKKPEPPKAPEPKPMTQAEMIAAITEAMDKSKDKTTAYRFEVERDKDGRIKAITAHPLNA